MRRRIPDRLLYVLAPALLVLVACTQRVLVHTQDLTAWKGGGFGMFSTYDGPGARTLRLIVVTPDGEAVVAFPNLSTLETRLVYFPTAGILRDLAEQTAAGAWTLYRHDRVVAMKHDLPEEFQRQLSRDAAARRRLLAADSTTVLPAPYPEYLALTSGSRSERFGGVEAEVIGARAEVWRLIFDSDARQFRGELLRGVSVEVP